MGTALDTSSDAPALDCAYKLQEYAGKPRRKRSEGKATWPGRKQVYRSFDSSGRMAGDVVALEQGDPQQGLPLLHHVMHDGKRVGEKAQLAALRQQMLASYASLPPALAGLDTSPAYSVTISPALRELAGRIDREAA